MNLYLVLPYISIIGFIIFGAAMIYTQWKLGASKVASEGTKVGVEVIQTYKEQVSQLRDEIESSRKLISDLTVKVAKLESAAAEKDKKISELTLFLTGKSPDQEDYMKRMDGLREMVVEFIKRADEREEKMFTIIRNRQAYIVPLEKKAT